MEHLWTTEDLMAALHGRPMGNMPAGITGISIDSRSIGKGEAFFAIKGDRVDGHDYAGIAIANGAALLVVSETKLPALGRLSHPMIVVDDVLEALVRLGCAARDRSGAKIIAVTGSVGKTTTKEMLRHGLSASGRVHASPASFNNHWGVPLTLARMPEHTNFGIFEIGMNHPGEIRPLVKMVRPHVAVVTTVAPVHIGFFRDVEEIAAAKAEIFEGVAPGGHAILNRDNAHFAFLETAAKAAGVPDLHSFGASTDADYRILSFSADGGGGRLRADIDGRLLDVTLGAPGRHMAENALIVLGAAAITGADLQKTAAALLTFNAGKGRGERHHLAVGNGFFTLIDESYNANPTSMAATIAVLGEAEPGEGGRRIAVLGDMLEMGDGSPQAHAALSEPLVKAGISDVWLAGPDMAHLRDALPADIRCEYRSSVDALTAFVVTSVASGDVVMVKSSNGTGCGRIVAALVAAYPPRKES